MRKSHTLENGHKINIADAKFFILKNTDTGASVLLLANDREQLDKYLASVNRRAEATNKPFITVGVEFDECTTDDLIASGKLGNLIASGKYQDIRMFTDEILNSI